MARITAKSRNRIDARFTIEELNTLTIALALLDIETMEEELAGQGLSNEKVEYDHLTLFKALTDITGLYPQVQLEDEEA